MCRVIRRRWQPAQAGRVLEKVGVSTSDAITMFLRQVTLCRDRSGLAAAMPHLQAGRGGPILPRITFVIH